MTGLDAHNNVPLIDLSNLAIHFAGCPIPGTE